MDDHESDPEPDSTWENLLRTHPQRLVDIFDFDYDAPHQTNKWGDTPDVGTWTSP